MYDKKVEYSLNIPYPKEYSYPKRLCLLDVQLTPRTTPAAVDLVFKYMSLWGTVSYKGRHFHSNPIHLNEQQMGTLMLAPNTLFL